MPKVLSKWKKEIMDPASIAVGITTLVVSTGFSIRALPSVTARLDQMVERRAVENLLNIDVRSNKVLRTATQNDDMARGIIMVFELAVAPRIKKFRVYLIIWLCIVCFSCILLQVNLPGNAEIAARISTVMLQISEAIGLGFAINPESSLEDVDVIGAVSLNLFSLSLPAICKLSGYFSKDELFLISALNEMEKRKDEARRSLASMTATQVRLKHREIAPQEYKDFIEYLKKQWS